MAHFSSNHSRIDSRSGFCKSNSTFYSKRKPLPLPQNDAVDITTFISSRAHHGKIAFIDASTGQQLTFSDVWRAVDSVATCLSDMGVRKGHVILLLSPNSIFFPIVCLAVMSLGAIITTTNPLNTPSEIAKQIADSKPVLAFTTPQLVPKLSNTNLQLIIIDDVTNPPQKSTGIVTTLQEMMKKPPSQTRVKERVTKDDSATLLYSSGTTGPSKGVVSSHSNLIAFAQTMSNRFKSEERNQTCICTVPMFHVYGLAAFASGFLASGSTVVVLSKFDMDEMLCAIQKYSATYLPLVPPILVALVKHVDVIKKKYDLGSLESVVSGGSSLSREVIEEFMEKYPNVIIYQGYALTESWSGSSTFTVEESRRYGAAGMLSPSMEAKIVDSETGTALTVNETGELWLRGPTVMKGYLGNEEATALTLTSEGWLKTGDLCYIDEDGFVFVVDRLKELIKYKAYQVPPSELEALLLFHSEVVDAAVIPFPDKEVGQIPMAYIVRKTGSAISEISIMDFIAKQVAPYKKIRRVAFVDSIPKNPSGKILRRVLIELAISKL